MRKEVWFAIVGGILLGLVIGFGIYRINFSYNKDVATESTPNPQSNSGTGIAIAKPNYDDVITSSPVNISGIASKNSMVIISNDKADYLVKNSESGTFEKDMDLTGGINQIVITAISEDKKTSSEKLRLVYSTQMQSSKPDNNDTDEETSTESGVRETVLKKVEDILNSPKAYLGTVTDIAEKTIQVKTDSDSIEQVFAEEGISVINQSPSPKEVKFTDIAIGDYIVAMGYKNGNNVLNTKRILITSPSTFPQIDIITGKVESISKKEIILDEDKKAIISTSTKLSDKNIAKDDQVIVVGTLVKDVFSARTIFLVE